MTEFGEKIAQSGKLRIGFLNMNELSCGVIVLLRATKMVCCSFLYNIKIFSISLLYGFVISRYLRYNKLKIEERSYLYAGKINMGTNGSEISG